MSKKKQRKALIARYREADKKPLNRRYLEAKKREKK